jgi:hypothetical protein
MNVLVTAQHVLILKTCGECGITFGLPKQFDLDRRQTGGGWCCPNGHQRVYSETEFTRLQKQAILLQQKLDQLAARTKESILEKESIERRLIAEKGQRTKMQNRIARGVCPCCNRSFEKLQRHMTTEHPHYASAETLEAKP